MIIQCPACGWPTETSKPQQLIMTIECERCAQRFLGVMEGDHCIEILSVREVGCQMEERSGSS